MKIMVIGSGKVGLGICEVIMISGHEVILNDLNDELIEKGVIEISKSIDDKANKGILRQDEKVKIINNLSATTNLKEAVNCDLIIEAINENIEAKKILFKELDYICQKKTILASTTPSISITEISMSTNRLDKIIGIHFFSLENTINMIEVIDSIYTSQQTRDFINNLCKDLNKTYVNVKESPGFIVNRLMIPMINEAISIYAQNIASAEDIDNAMKVGANHLIGPLALGDLIGLDVCLDIMENLYNEFSDSKYRPHPYLKKMVRANLLGRKTKKGFYNYK